MLLIYFITSFFSCVHLEEIRNVNTKVGGKIEDPCHLA